MYDTTLHTNNFLHIKYQIVNIMQSDIAVVQYKNKVYLNCDRDFRTKLK